MRFVLYGNGEVPWCTEVHHKRSLEALGHEVLLLQENRETTDRVLEESLQADALIWVHTHSFKNPGSMSMDRVLRLLKLAGKPTIAVHLDLYMGLRRWNDYEDSAYMRVEHFFTVDKLMAEWFNKNTDTKGHFLPAGVLEDECYISDQPSPHANDVIFVGSRSYHPEWPWRPKLIDWLRDTYGQRFTHVGRDGQTGILRGDDLNRLYANSKVAVGDTLCLNFEYPFYASDRLFEAGGRGAFQAFPYITGLDEWFTDGEHLRFFKFGDLDGLKALIDYYLEHDDEREQIRRAGHEHVKAHHTYKHRWSEILEVVG
ncbi:glycosyltransferase [Nocardia abscessus]|uniref:glycosyltransferase n=1 Tax=Nocardia abscessus TaxID=120957 RepID=UPI0024568CD2|nr:glycosyltransferase [Nocardia abscessus]